MGLRGRDLFVVLAAGAAETADSLVSDHLLPGRARRGGGEASGPRRAGQRGGQPGRSPCPLPAPAVSVFPVTDRPGGWGLAGTPGLPRSVGTTGGLGRVRGGRAGDKEGPR